VTIVAREKCDCSKFIRPPQDRDWIRKQLPAFRRERRKYFLAAPGFGHHLAEILQRRVQTAEPSAFLSAASRSPFACCFSATPVFGLN